MTGVRGSAAGQARQARRARLGRLKLSALLKAARAAGVPQAALDAAADTEDHAAAVVELLVARHAR